MAKIIGNTTATPNLRSDWNQTDETKVDYIKNKPTILTKEDIAELIPSGSGGIPVVHELPVDAKDGDMCLYAPMNIITLEDSGKRIYFDWEEFSQPLIDKWMDLAFDLQNNNESSLNIGAYRGDSVGGFQISHYNRNDSMEFHVTFTNGELDVESSYMFTYLDGESEEIYFNSIDELPLYWRLPQFDYIETYANEVDEPLFYSEYCLMTYRCGEWQDNKSAINIEDVVANTVARHDHINQDILDAITAQMLEERIPTVHILPENAKAGDMCLYSPMNQITLEDSGKRIYFEWDNIKHYSANDNLILYSFYLEGSEVGKIKIDGKIRQYTFYRSSYEEDPIGGNSGIYTQFLQVNFSNNTFNSAFSGLIWPDGGITGRNIDNIKNIPLYWDLPTFDQIVAKTPVTTDAYLFRTEYQLIKYQGGEWSQIGTSNTNGEGGSSHEHDNKDVLDKLGGNNSTLKYNDYELWSENRGTIFRKFQVLEDDDYGLVSVNVYRVDDENGGSCLLVTDEYVANAVDAINTRIDEIPTVPTTEDLVAAVLASLPIAEEVDF